MSLRRLRPAEWLAGLAGLVLLISLFLHWYDLTGSGWTAYAPGGPRSSFTAWQAFTVTDVVLALLALSGPALWLAQATRESPSLPIALTIVAVTAGAVAAILVGVRILAQPGPNAVVGVAIGAWIGLAAALALLGGAWWALGTERAPGAPVPGVELRPAPPA